MKQRCTPLLLVCAFVASCQAAPEGEPLLDTTQQRASYAQGFGLGRQGQGLPLDVDAFVQGIPDGLDGEARLTEEEMQDAANEFRDLMSEAGDTEAEGNRKAGEAFLRENQQREGVRRTQTGLQYEVIEEGEGEHPTATDVVRVHYRGTTIDGTVFDESYARGEPSTFPLNRVISGWTEGIQLMGVGSKYKFYIPSELAYGENAPPGASFGANSALIFEVELLDIVQG